MSTLYKRGYDKKVAMSLFEAESTYDGGVTMTDSGKACLMSAYESAVELPDEIINDKEDIGNEFGHDQERINKQVKYTYTEAKAKPNTLAGLGALIIGDISSTAGAQGYVHTITPIANTADLESIQIDEYFGGVRHEYTGMVGESLKIMGEAGRMIGIEATLWGSGNREEEAGTTYPDKISESWMKAYQTKVWMENGASIDISATPTQESASISSGTAESLDIYLESFEFTWNNNLEGRFGFGSETFQRIDYLKRSAELSLVLLFRNEDEMDYFNDQTALAFEVDCAGSYISGTTGAKYGFKLIIPRFKLRTAPVPTGGVNEFLKCTYDCEIFDDETNDIVQLIVYNNQAAYLA